jgi:hypothetical protein
MMKVSVAFRTYRQCRRNNTLVQNMLRIFDSMTEYILNSKSIDYNFDLLHQLSLINKEGTISQSPEEYQLAKEFRQFFKTYSQYMEIKNRNVEVIKVIIDATSSLIIQAKSSIYNFIWSLPGFRKALSKFDTTDANGIAFNGADYTKNSIFSSILSAHKREYTSNRASFRAFKTLSAKMEREEFDAVFSYLMKIVRANRQYTYDNVGEFAPVLSTYELLGTVLILIIKLIQHNPTYVFEQSPEQNSYRVNREIDGRVEDVWDLINILYFTVFEIKRSTSEAYKYNNDAVLEYTTEFERTHDPSITPRVRDRRRLVEEGKTGLERLVTIIRQIDVKFVDSIIFANADYILDNLNTSIIFRVRRYILERKIKKNTHLSAAVCGFTHQVLQSRSPAQLKSEFIRLVMAYNLHTEYIELGTVGIDRDLECNPYLEVLTEYLLTDARKLNNTSLVHSIDVLDHFSGFLFMAVNPDHPNYLRCVKVTRLYLGYLKETTALYGQMVSNFLNVPDHIKPNILSDMMSVSGYCKDLILMVGQIGNEALEYIEPLLLLIEQVVNTKELMNIPIGIDPTEISVIDQVRPTYIKKFRPLLLRMLEQFAESAIYTSEDTVTALSEEWRMIYSMYQIKSDLSFSGTVFRLILRSESIRILKEIFDIDLHREGIMHIVVNSDLSNCDMPQDSLDGLTYDLIVSPVAIPVGFGVDDVVLVNQRTMHTILLDGINPFNRQPLTYEAVVEMNDRPEIRERVDRAMDELRRLN